MLAGADRVVECGELGAGSLGLEDWAFRDVSQWTAAKPFVRQYIGSSRCVDIRNRE